MLNSTKAILYVVHVNGRYADEYSHKVNAEAHAEMARRQGNLAYVEETESYDCPLHGLMASADCPRC